VRLLDCSCVAPDKVVLQSPQQRLNRICIQLTLFLPQFAVVGEQGWLALYDFRFTLFD
jgi:hypothetical protein